MNNKKTNTKICEPFEAGITDHELLWAYTKGDCAAFECLYTRYKNTLLTHLLRQSGNLSIAEDLAHDVWLGVIKSAASFQPTASFKTWLYRIAHNRLVDHWRKNGHANNALCNELSQINNDLEDRSSELFEIEQLLKLLATLSPEQTTAMLLKIEGFSQAEIANITDSKQETVKSRLRYATQHLRLSVEASV